MERFFPSARDLKSLTNNDAAQTSGVVKILRRWYDAGRAYTYEDALQALNTLLDGHGIESVDPEGAPDFISEGIRMCPPYSYVNMGDSYATTIAFDHANSKWLVSCWAELLEAVEKEYKLGDYEEYEERPERCRACHSKSIQLVTDLTFSGDVRSWWICRECDHHHRTPEGFTPPAEEDE